MEYLQFSIIFDNIGALIEGVGVTLGVTSLSFALALIIGTLVGITHRKHGPMAKIMNAYVEFFRGSPLLIQLFFIYYGLPSIGISLNRMTAAIVGLGLNGGAYIAEVIRGALISVPVGQEEAAYVLGFSRFQILRYIVFPQALRVALPALMNAFSSTLKDSSLVSVLAITEVSRIGQLIYTRTFKAFEIYSVVAFTYFLLTWFVSRVSRKIEIYLKY